MIHSMKKICLPAFLILATVCFTQCGPAAEDRVRMHEIAKRVSDSIGHSVDSQLTITAMPQGVDAPVVKDTTKK
jgi:hypothetical protein